MRDRILAVMALAEHGSGASIEPLLDCAENDPEGEAGAGCMRCRTTARRDAFLALAEIGLRHSAEKKRIVAAVAALPARRTRGRCTRVPYEPGAAGADQARPRVAIARVRPGPPTHPAEPARNDNFEPRIQHHHFQVILLSGCRGRHCSPCQGDRSGGHVDRGAHDPSAIGSALAPMPDDAYSQAFTASKRM